jgi:CheY-like chemotaxis protein
VNKSDSTKYRFLLVDDEPSVRRSIQMLLEHDGHKVESAEDGAAALAIYETDKFDLVVTDYSMPGMKGSELVEIIKLRSPNQRIIMVTAFASGIEQDARLIGKIDLLLEKPFSLTELREGIARVLS